MQRNSGGAVEPLKIAFIGAGRLATNLAPALQAAGCELLEVWSRTRESASELAARLKCHAAWGHVGEATTEADVYIISVSDAALQEVVGALHKGREGALFAHTAGSMPLGLFAEAGHERGGVFYPMQTFSKQRAVDFSRLHFFIEATTTEDLRLLAQLASGLTAEEHIHEAGSAERRRLHLAAVFACNFANRCFALADDILQEAGLPFDAMLPLIQETVEKLNTLSPEDAQTGPAVRHDSNVIGMQRAMLLQRPDLLAVYDTLTRSIQQPHSTPKQDK